MNVAHRQAQLTQKDGEMHAPVFFGRLLQAKNVIMSLTHVQNKGVSLVTPD